MMKLHRRPTRHNSGFTITEAAELLANVMRVKAERDRAVEDLDQLRRQHLDLLAQAQQPRSVDHSDSARPIVWDGTDLAWVRVRAALPAGMEATARVDASMTIYRSSDDRILATVIRGGRIRIEGDSFAILPPEVKP